MELNFIELPKFTKKEEDCQSLADKWIYFIKNAEDLRVIPENIEVEEIKLAYETVEQFGWTEEELALYEARSRFVASQMDALETAIFKGIEKGKKEGIREGLREGLKEGLKEGIEKGEKKAKLEIVKKLISQGVDNSIIFLTTGLTEKDIKKIR